MKGLTSEFEMGSGISPSLLPPRKSCVGFKNNIFEFFLTDIKQRLIDIAFIENFRPLIGALGCLSTAAAHWLFPYLKGVAGEQKKSDQANGPISIG